ncbi:hypothetical protein O3M35_000729 [Rhynocoris fuscipes]|uniref:Uncharacterized protein n=1 Tax=Rhynocoris fuscipes TaxID=488301 RepID=A0AAW1DMS6_9HEMI
MEMLLSEISIIRPLCRDILFGNEQHRIHMFGPLIYEVDDLYRKAKMKALPPWTVNCELTLKIARCTKLFTEYIMDRMDTEKRCGGLIIDLINLIINKQYKISVQYYPIKESCDIHVVYVYENPQFLSRLPRFSLSDESTITSEDRKNILMYLLSLVRINNRIVLREEQFLRESELTVRTNFTTHALSVPPTNWLYRDVRSYNECLPNPSREILKTDEDFLIQEEYATPSFKFEIERKGCKNNSNNALQFQANASYICNLLEKAVT